MRLILILTLILFLVLFLTGCQDMADSKPENRREGSKILLNYAKTPLDRAKHAEKIHKKRNKKMDDRLAEFDH